MPRNIKVIHASDFVRATPEGKANIEKAELLLKEIAEAGAGLDGFQVLVDTRRARALAAVGVGPNAPLDVRHGSLAVDNWRFLRPIVPVRATSELEQHKKVLESSGPAWIRTRDQGIMSPLL
jgi:hypothetical protein